MRTSRQVSTFVLACLLAVGPPVLAAGPDADTQKGTGLARVTGVVRDGQNAVALPGVPVEVAGTQEVAYTDVDGRFVLVLPPGTYELRATLDGYQTRSIAVQLAAGTTVQADIALSMNRFAEEVTVTAEIVDAETSSAAAQLAERKHAPVITDNLGAADMKANGDSDAAAALQRVTGLSVVDNQYVFVRGLGERYSNTTLAGSVVPTTEPDKKVVPLDLFPAGLLDSVQVAKTYSPDRPAEFAGGLVQVVPVKIPSRPLLDLTYGLGYYETATGKSVPFSPLGTRDWLGFDAGARALPSGFPEGKVVRRGIFTPTVGYPPDEIAAFGRLLENRWSPASRSGRPGQNWSVAYGSRFGRLGVLASVTHSYKEQYVEEIRRFFRLEEDGALERVTDYAFRTGSEKAQLGAVANLAYQFTPNHRVAVENFYTHVGRDEGRSFEGPNTENNQYFRNYRLQFVEEGLLSNSVTGDHFLPRLANSRFDWRITYGRAERDEPDLRETLYQSPLPLAANPTFLLADESQSGFRLFQALDDRTVDVSVNWSAFTAVAGRPLVVKAGPSYVRRDRDFTSRRFRFIPTSLAAPALLARPPEQIYTPQNIGTAFRFNEETRPVDAYDASIQTLAVYGMVDAALGSRLRIVGGVRVEDFTETVNTFDPFGLFAERITAELAHTDVFPGVNLVYSLAPDTNLRLGYSQTVNRPEFRELAAFEFTDVVGNRAVRGNPALRRALVRNIDARWERFTAGGGIVAASAFYKAFEDPIERVIQGGAQPLQTFENAGGARNVGFELEAAQRLGRHVSFSANYTRVGSRVTLTEAARRVQTSRERALAGQSKNLFNAIGEIAVAGFTARVLYSYFGDRIADVGASGAPDIVEQGRGSLDLALGQRLGRVQIRLTLENLTDAEHRFEQGPEVQRLFKSGRVALLSLGYSAF